MGVVRRVHGEPRFRAAGAVAARVARRALLGMLLVTGGGRGGRAAAGRDGALALFNVRAAVGFVGADCAGAVGVVVGGGVGGGVSGDDGGSACACACAVVAGAPAGAGARGRCDGAVGAEDGGGVPEGGGAFQLPEDGVLVRQEVAEEAGVVFFLKLQRGLSAGAEDARGEVGGEARDVVVIGGG